MSIEDTRPIFYDCKPVDWFCIFPGIGVGLVCYKALKGCQSSTQKVEGVRERSLCPPSREIWKGLAQIFCVPVIICGLIKLIDLLFNPNRQKDKSNTDPQRNVNSKTDLMLKDTNKSNTDSPIQIPIEEANTDSPIQIPVEEAEEDLQDLNTEKSKTTSIIDTCTEAEKYFKQGQEEKNNRNFNVAANHFVLALENGHNINHVIEALDEISKNHPIPEAYCRIAEYFKGNKNTEKATCYYVMAVLGFETIIKNGIDAHTESLKALKCLIELFTGNTNEFYISASDPIVQILVREVAKNESLRNEVKQIASLSKVLGDYYLRKQDKANTINWYKAAANTYLSKSLLTESFNLYHKTASFGDSESIKQLIKFYKPTIDQIKIYSDKNAKALTEAFTTLSKDFKEKKITLSEEVYQALFDNVETMEQLGDLYLKQDAKNFYAIYWYIQAAENTINGTDKEFSLHLKAADLGKAGSQLFVAEAYKLGVVTTKNLDLAEKYYLLACEGGNANAMCKFEHFLRPLANSEYKNEITEIYMKKATDWLKKEDNKDSRAVLYRKYISKKDEKGRFTLTNNLALEMFNTKKKWAIEESFKWLEKAADLKHPDAHYTLGSFYNPNTIYDIPKDAKLSFYHYTEAAKLGHTEAMVFIANKHAAMAQNINQINNTRLAIEWYEKAIQIYGSSKYHQTTAKELTEKVNALKKNIPNE